MHETRPCICFGQEGANHPQLALKEAGMERESVSIERWLELVNEEMKTHLYYKEGMLVVPTGGSGYDITCPEGCERIDCTAVLHAVIHKVNEKYVADV